MLSLDFEWRSRYATLKPSEDCVMDYGNLLHRAWNIAWRQRALWVFGLALALFQGSVDLQSRQDRGDIGPFGGPGAGQGMDWALIAPLIAGIATFAVIVGIAVFLLRIIVGAIGRGGLISGASAADEGFSPNIRDTWHAVRERLRPLVIVDAVISIPFGIVIFALVLGLIVLFVPALASGNPMSLIAVAPGLIIGAVAIGLIGLAGGLIVSVVPILASAAVMIEGADWQEALKMTWTLVKARPLPIFLIWLIASVAGAVVQGIAAFPAALIGLMIGSLVAGSTASMIVTGPLIVLGIPAVLLAFLVRSILATFQISLWTLAYQEWRDVLVVSSPEPVAPPVEDAPPASPAPAAEVAPVAPAAPIDLVKPEAAPGPEATVPAEVESSSPAAAPIDLEKPAPDQNATKPASETPNEGEGKSEN